MPLLRAVLRGTTGAVYTYGANTVINGNYLLWTGDNPDNWVVSELAPNIVTQNGNACRFVTVGPSIYIRQPGTTETGKTYRLKGEIKEVISGGIRFGDGVVGLTAYGVVNTLGTFEIIIEAVGIDFQITNSGSCDITFTDISLEERL